MRTSPRRLSAFTLYELAVVLVLSSLVIYGSLTAYGFVASLIRDQQADREVYHRLNELDEVIREDLARAEVLAVAGDGSGLTTNTIAYTVRYDTLWRLRASDGEVGGRWPCPACSFAKAGERLQLHQGGTAPRSLRYELTFGPTPK